MHLQKTYMKIHGCLAVTMGTLAIAALVQGCASDTTNDGGQAGHSAVKYANNALQVSENMPLNLTEDAANAALKELQIPAATDKKDPNNVRLAGQDANNQAVIIQLLGKNRYTTDVQITVGTTDSTENRAEEQQIYVKMKDHY